MKKLNYMTIALACLLSVPAQAQNAPVKTVTACVIEVRDTVFNLKTVNAIQYLKGGIVGDDNIRVVTNKDFFYVKGDREFFNLLTERMKLCHSN